MDYAELLQKTYYEKSAVTYDDLHALETEHRLAANYISSFIASLSVSSILDVGCGTGRGLSYLVERHPNVRAYGIEPVPALLERARERNITSRDSLLCGSGAHLPFADASIDAVCEFAVLHHVRKPNEFVREMTRVARKAVFISDCNRFGQGGFATRLAKLLLYKAGLWDAANFFLTRGKGYKISEGDGLFYSYSVFDSCAVLSEWADRIIFMPTSNESSNSIFQPLLTAKQVLVCALKDEPPPSR
jgi:ubiquinone/menaquinone biosynthesis C-methylase UbiE